MPLKLPLVVAIIVAVFKNRADVVAENIALRHQLSCLRHRKSRPQLRTIDRVFWVLLSHFWSRWTELLAMVKPATVLAWHRQGFKLFWRWKSRKRGPGRPRIPEDVRKRIVQMAEMNVGWGAPRIHGELLKLGIEISEITVSRHMPKRPHVAGSRQRWATFLHNHVRESLAIDFAVMPTVTFGILYVFFVLSRERQLRRVVGSYLNYYHEDRTHLGLGKDTPEKRAVEPRKMGKVVAIPRVGGLHHRYSRELRSVA